ncbi:MAG: DNA repair protein RecN [Anaerosomatales bacterium]|nr:DNA repair protein RecN [Anaerosomatales bacterium]MDT8433221.1 DNA repair protein RecN [Anaerosomatales bacterium]
MLEEVHVRNFALIDEAWIEFGSGLTVLTGETGAGKTALVGALKLLLGERADSGVVRSGAAEAVVEGRFRVDGAEVVARRRLTADGRSRCTLDGSMATVGELARVLGPLVDLHGQHEHQALLTPGRHVGYLDRYIGEEAADALGRYRSAREAHLAAESDLGRLTAELADAERRADYLRFVLEEIAAVDPAPGEDEELEKRLPALIHAEKLAEAARAANAATRGEGGAVDAIASARAVLQRVEGLDDTLDALGRRLASASAELEDIGAEMRTYADGLEHDPRALDDVQSRLAALSGLKKKYGPSLELVFAARDDATERLAAVETGDAKIARARERVEERRLELVDAAEKLVAVRHSETDSFTDALATAIEGLNMAGARFEVSFDELEFDSWGPDGPERVEFLFAPAEGEPARPLAKIASGGEISRVMLALKSALGGADDVPVLVFDEVDAGIGGVTGLAVGARLAGLAGDRQVLVVTHLPQVAAYATHHLVVHKDTVEGRTVTTVEPVDGEARVAEIARMLSGSDTDASLAHAEELLAQASGAASGTSR